MLGEIASQDSGVGSSGCGWMLQKPSKPPLPTPPHPTSTPLSLNLSLSYDTLLLHFSRSPGPWFPSFLLLYMYILVLLLILPNLFYRHLPLAFTFTSSSHTSQQTCEQSPPSRLFLLLLSQFFSLPNTTPTPQQPHPDPFLHLFYLQNGNGFLPS